MVEKIPCKRFYCTNDRAPNYWYCSEHNDGADEIDDLDEAAKYTAERFRESEDHIVDTWKFTDQAAVTFVYEGQWDWLMETMARAWDVDVDRLEDNVTAVLYDEYGSISYT